jgi:regulator of sigma E protease
MSGILIDIVAVAFILGFLILIHEFGHYAVAKLLGVRVEQFAIGFGKRLLGFKKGETDYRINILPLGGYVKMSGENPMDTRSGDPREFLSHSRWHRFLIAIAGPSMNILLAIGLLTVVYMVRYEYASFMDQSAVVAWVKHDSPAAKAGIQPGDRIARIDDVTNPTWKDVSRKTVLSPNQPLDVVIQRGAQTFEKTITPVAITSYRLGSAGWTGDEHVVVWRTEPNMPAAQAGIKDGDNIVSINGTPLPSSEMMIDLLQETKGQPIDIRVMRGGHPLDFHVTPVLANTEDPGEKRYRIGFQPIPETKVGRLSLPQAFAQSVDENRANSTMILELVEKLVQHKVSVKTLSSPIGIAQAAGEAAQEKGWMPLLEYTAAISLNLGILNLMPIPILDGGMILFLLIEGLMRRDISLAIKERVYQAAFVFLILFFVMTIYNDIARTLPGMRLP